MSSEKFCLRWNDFESNISFAFRELRDDKDFFDVTLACDDEQIQAHKVILSACSPFFRNVLRRNLHQHPLLYLKGVKYTDLQSVLNFMYHGEVNVAQEELNSFLAVAEDLRVKGLTQNQGASSTTNSNKRESYSQPKSPPSKPIPRPPPDRDSIQPPKRPRQEPNPPSNSHSLIRHSGDDDIQEVVPVKSEPRDHVPSAPQPPQALYQPQTHTDQGLVTSDPQNMQTMVYQEEGYDDYSQYEVDQYEGGMGEQEMVMDGSKGSVNSMLQETEGGTMCLVCEKVMKYRHDALRHIRMKHTSSANEEVSCQICGKILKHHWALGDHMRKTHGQYAKKVAYY